MSSLIRKPRPLAAIRNRRLNSVALLATLRSVQFSSVQPLAAIRNRRLSSVALLATLRSAQFSWTLLGVIFFLRSLISMF